MAPEVINGQLNLPNGERCWKKMPKYGSEELEAQKKLEKQKELEARNRLLALWDIKVLHGYHPQVSQVHKTFAVQFTSRQFDGDSKTFLWGELERKTIIRDLSEIGSFKKSDFGVMLDIVDSLKESGTVTEVKFLVDFTNDMISEAAARDYFDDLVDEIIENQAFFPTLSSNQYLLGDKFGVLLDTEYYKNKFRLSADDAAFGVTKEFLYGFLRVSDYRDPLYREIINGWANHGFLSRVTQVKDRHEETVNVGGIQKRFYLFCIRGGQTRLRQAVEGVQP